MQKITKLALFVGLFAGFGSVVPAYAGDGGEVFGTGLGAALGGIVGNQFGRGGGNVAATVTGVVVGGLIGNGIGQSYDNSQRAAAYANYGGYGYAAPGSYYSPVYEPNYVAPDAPSPSRTVYYEPSAAYSNAQPAYVTRGYVGVSAVPSRYCREFTQSIIIGGQPQDSYGTACQQPDGTWRIQP